jgi:hypothetical protein
VNKMAEIILSRYERFTRTRCLTHFTTNLSADEIEERYGSRVRSRLREMCNPSPSWLPPPVNGSRTSDFFVNKAAKPSAISDDILIN